MYRRFIKNSIRILISVSALAAVLFVLFSYVLPLSRSFIIAVVTYPARCFTGANLYLQSRTFLIEENKLLRKDVGELHLKIEQFKTLREENKRFRDLLGFKNISDFKTIPAEVISRNPNDWIDSFLINKGSKDGIQKDSAVCTRQGLLGKVSDLSENTSTVILLSHPAFRAGGEVRDTGIHGIVSGAGTGLAKMLYLPADAEVTEDDVVVTSGFSRVFPKGLVIGRVSSVERSRTGMCKYAVIEPSCDLFGQEEVLCIRE